ncbi:Sapep family Mn(2+)-dependent dipeptidase [Crassaminicella profunda]|uniref:Sapep family Mn(2+)-dependent dipeptidase n=1 Tax=Crassaminicella profunda TaxID=1286698 RepID=UPI001CA71FF4|nr:Sapep family Mn(2+)-dependent dipeptidase [Crassaminicella profunda]QZY55802.1 Sapep family Mn(2+)-dependent dipeptidase [Crassaminicella profunda]
MEKKLNEKIDEVKTKLIEDIIEIVKIPSVKGTPEKKAPFGRNINKALFKALEISEKLGFKTENIDGYMGYAQLGDDENYIGIVGHVDVVLAKEGWCNPPFSGNIENGKIYGRGVLDNKGPIMSALYALYAIKESKLKLSKTIRIIFGTDEESGFSDIPYYLNREKPPIMGFTPDCKYPVVYGERGRAKIKIGIDMNKENYEKLTREFFDFVNTYFLASKSNGDRLGINYSDKEFGMMQMRNYNLDNKDNYLNFTFDLSYPATCTIDEIIKQIESKMSCNLEIELLNNYNPVKFEKKSFLIRSLQEAYEEVTHLDGSPVTTTGGTYAKVMPNIVPFGPSFPGQKGIAHNPNEYMDMNDIVLNAKIFSQAIYKLAK